VQYSNTARAMTDSLPGKTDYEIQAMEELTKIHLPDSFLSK
jgi:hypothetical protein